MKERIDMGNVMEAAFDRAGGPTKVIAALDVALALFRNNGGTYEKLIERSCAAYGLSGEAKASVLQGHYRAASARQQNGDGAGQIVSAEEANPVVPALSPQNRGGSGQTTGAREGHSWGSRPVREPTAASLTAMRSVRKMATAATLTVFDSWKIRDGRSIGDLTFGELESLRFENAREASIIRQIQRHAAYADADAKVRDILKIEDLHRMIQRGAEVADVA